MQAAERRYLQLADHVLAVSESDRNCFARFLDARKLTVIPTGVDVGYFHPTATDEVPDSIVFTGSMDWLPNEDAMLYFIEEIFPLIRQQIPRASLCLVGRKPSSRLQALCRKETNLQLTGRVDDVLLFLARALFALSLCASGVARVSRSLRP